MSKRKFKEIACKVCNFDRNRRRVVIRRPLEEIKLDLPDGWKEFYCKNTIKVLRRWNRDESGTRQLKWFEEECGNRLLIRRGKFD